MFDIADDLEFVAGACGQVLRSFSDARPSTYRASVSMSLFEPVAQHAWGLSKFRALVTEKNALAFAPSTAALIRSGMEACDVFAYHYIDPESEDAFFLRLNIRRVHHDREEGEVFEKLRLLDKPRLGKRFSFEGFYGTHGLKDNPLFSTLPEKVQRDALKGTRARVSPLRFNRPPFDMTDDERRGLYKLLSNCAHATSLGASVGASIAPQMALSVPRLMPLLGATALHVFSWTLDGYLGRRRTLAREFGREERRRLKAIRNRGVGELLDQIRRVAAEGVI